MANLKKYIGPNRLSEIFSYIKAELDKKVTAVSGKGLSSNDYTTTEKNKLAGISSGAEVNVQADWDVDNTSSDAYILHKPTSMPASDVPSWAKQPNKPSYTFSEITSKPTTIAGYGITDAKITNGTITLGSNSITPLTQHQDISGKADKATTLAGYGITDAKIANGTITLGSNSITPLTQHQSVTNKGATLAWSSAVTVATIGSTDIKVSLPANPNTDTKVTSVGNHYAPAEDSTAQLDADASSSTAATWNSTSLVTGVTVKRDAKGHVTGLAVDSIKMPANPNTNTTYTFADGTNGFTVTPSGGTAQTVKVTPSITNNVTGSGTSGYLAKFNGANTIASGPQLGSGTNTYLRNDGSWATPPDTNTTYTIATGDSNGQIKVTPSSGSAYNVSVKGLGSNAYTSTAYVPVRKNTDTYTTLANYYSGGTTPTYVRISFPEGVANIWFMLNMEILIRQKYDTDLGGKIIVNAHHGTGSPGTWTGKAITFGNFDSNVRVYGASGRYIYIIAIGNYTTVTITHAVIGDSARSVDLSGTTIDAVSEMPTTYQTFATYRGMHDGNYTDYTVSKTGTGASGTWGISITGSAGSVAWSNVSSKPTTISGYGITDAKIANGVITLGSNTITPLTSITSSQVTTALGYTPYNSTNPNGYITSSGSCASATSATKVTQTGLTGYNYTTKYEVLLSGTADNTTREDGVNKTANITATQSGALYTKECYTGGFHAGGDALNHRGAVYFYKDTDASVYSYVKMQPVCSDATNKEILVPDENGTLATREFLQRIDLHWGPSNSFRMVKTAWQNWGTTMTMTNFILTSVGILIASHNIFTIWRSGASPGNFTVYKIGGNSTVTISGTLSGDNVNITASTTCTMAAFWLSYNQ